MASRRTSREVSEMPIGRYTRLDEIGRGSFATVYQGVHTVRLKVLPVPSLGTRGILMTQ